MAEKLVPTVRTTPTMTDFARAMLRAWPEATKEGAGVLWAHFAGETGDGRYCWNFNLGNVKHVKGDGYDYVSLRGVWEGFTLKDEDGDGDIDADDKTILIERLLRSGLWELDPSADHAKVVGPRKISMIASPHNSATWFRAYPDIETGMARFLAMKQNPDSRYFSAWAFVLAGNPEGYGRELGRKGYYTASQDAYALSMRAKFDPWMRSTTFDEVLDAHERPTQPSIITADQLEPEQAIVRPTVPLERGPLIVDVV